MNSNRKLTFWGFFNLLKDMEGMEYIGITLTSHVIQLFLFCVVKNTSGCQIAKRKKNKKLPHNKTLKPDASKN